MKMTASKRGAARSGTAGDLRSRAVPIPATPDPLINTPLLSLGIDRRGVEHFWISSLNHGSGCIGFRLDEQGHCRTYPFPWMHEGFHSAVQTGSDTLWLCGRLDRMVSFNLRTGAFKDFTTGVSKERVYEGMIYDRSSGKILALAKPYHGERELRPTLAVSFDTRARRTVKVHELRIAECVSRVSFPNGDGTYSVLVQTPGETLLRWDPRTERVEARVLSTSPVWSQDGAEKKTCRLVSDERNQWYFPGYGWYNPARRSFSQREPRPAREMAWFGRRGRRLFGACNDGDNLSVHAWDLDSGRVTFLFCIPDADVFSLTLAGSGRIVAVNCFGIFCRFHAETGALEATHPLPTGNIAPVAAVCRTDHNHLIGGPFLGSRFWDLDLKTGQGMDCGRAQKNWGHITAMEKVDGRIYMATHPTGELMEYDPARAPRYPENPRTVADAPGGMRPVAMTQDGRHIYYACSNDYGRLGSVLARYDTRLGGARYAVNPLANLQIHSLVHDGKSRALVCGTTFHGDIMRCTPSLDVCSLAEIDAATLAVRRSVAGPRGWLMVSVAGPLDADRWLCQLYTTLSGGPEKWMILERRRFEHFADGAQREFPPQCRGGALYAGKPGLFLLNVDDRIELWDMCRLQALRTVFQPFDVTRYDGYLFAVQDASLIIVRSKELVIVNDCLGGR